jgi:hypothetical protein
VVDDAVGPPLRERHVQRVEHQLGSQISSVRTLVE